MSRNSVIVALVLLLAASWWFFHENPEAEVRDAHQELRRLISKTEGETTGTTLLDARVLQRLFAETCQVTGDAEMFAGSYSPEEMVSTVIRVRGMFISIDLTFHEMAIEFPDKDNALVHFTAVLVGRSKIEGEEAAGETRQVVSRLRKLEGKWLFTEFELAKLQNGTSANATS